MKLEARYIVAAALLWFVWKGQEMTIPWPQAPQVTVEATKPPADEMAWAEQLRPILPKMLPADRQYLASFYDAMKFVIRQDGERSSPIVGDTEKFTVLHAGSLQLAIERKKVGKYPGLDVAIDSVFSAACGADVSAVNPDRRKKLIAACNVLSYALAVKHE